MSQPLTLTPPQKNKPKTSVIIAIYKDVEALHCILFRPTRQTEKNIEIIVTKDGEGPAVANYIANRAMASANYLTFLSGDCVPHGRFVEMHLLTPNHHLYALQDGATSAPGSHSKSDNT